MVRRILNLASHYGYGGRKIASVLAEEGIYNRNGEHFHYSTIQNILKNILYTGVLRSGESYSSLSRIFKSFHPSNLNRCRSS